MLRLLPSSTLFPYTTLFRSCIGRLQKTLLLRPSCPDHSLCRRSTGYRRTELSPLFPRSGSSATPPSDMPSCISQADSRSEEHTSELQSRFDLVCRLLLEKKN